MDTAVNNLSETQKCRDGIADNIMIMNTGHHNLRPPLLTETDATIVLDQIRKNSLVIEDYVKRLDLIVNQEGHKRHEHFVKRIQERLYLLMAENDTFREVYWQHCLLEETRLLGRSEALID